MQNRILLLAMLTLPLALTASHANDGIRKFDFGWNELKPPEGFTKVVKEDLYSKTNGYGFLPSPSWVYYSGHFPYIPTATRPYLDAISRDGLSFYGTFAVDVPNGKYQVWYLLGYVQGGSEDRLNYGLTIGDRELRKASPSNKEAYLRDYYSGWDRDYRRGEDVFDRFIAPLQPEGTIEVTVTNGQLTLAGGVLNVCGMMVYPAEQKATFDREVARLRQVRRDHFYSVVKVTEPSETGTVAPLTAAEQARGYRLWPRNKMREMDVTAQPSPEELAETALKTVVARNQSETLILAVRPLADLTGANVTVTDLVSPGGQKIPADAIQVRLLFHRIRSTDGVVTPSHLASVRDRNLQAEVTKLYWLTFPVARDATPGVYSGAVTFTCAGKPTTMLPIKVKVLPIVLRDPYQDTTYVMQWTGPAGLYSRPEWFTHAESVNAQLKVFEHLKSVGLLPQLSDMPPVVVDAGKPTQHLEFQAQSLTNFCEQVEAHAKAFPGIPVVVALHRTLAGYWTPFERGANGWPLSRQTTTNWAALKEYFECFVKLHNAHPAWPEFYYVVGAEMSNGGEDHVLFGKKAIEIAKSIPGFKVISCPNGPFEARTYAPLVDVIAPNFAVPMSDEAFRGIPNEKTKLWIYQAFNRFSYGFYAARIKATGSFKEFYAAYAQNPYNDFDASESDVRMSSALPAPDGSMFSCANIETFGWGATDYRYVKTLEAWIAKAKDSRKPEAVKTAGEAQTFLTEFLDSINPDLGYYMSEAGWWDYSAYDTYRWQVSEQILKLQAALEGDKR